VLIVPLAVNDRVGEISKIRAAMERYPEVMVSFEHAWGHKVRCAARLRGAASALCLCGQPERPYQDRDQQHCRGARRRRHAPRALRKTRRVFGAKRIMWSSNYPAHPKFGGVKARLGESRKALASLSAEDQAWIFGRSALAFYPSLTGT
jgi:hypothetical protein